MIYLFNHVNKFQNLIKGVKPFAGEYINPKLLETFLRKPELMKEKRNLAEGESDINMYLYKYGVQSDCFTIILEGSALVQIGKEGMEFNAGLFSYYGVDALLDENEPLPLKSILNETKVYTPEFSLKINSYCVYLQITRKEWIDAVKQSLIERRALEGKSIPNLASSNTKLNESSIIEKK